MKLADTQKIIKKEWTSTQKESARETLFRRFFFEFFPFHFIFKEPSQLVRAPFATAYKSYARLTRTNNDSWRVNNWWRARKRKNKQTTIKTASTIYTAHSSKRSRKKPTRPPLLRPVICCVLFFRCCFSSDSLLFRFPFACYIFPLFWSNPPAPSFESEKTLSTGVSVFV